MTRKKILLILLAIIITALAAMFCAVFLYDNAAIANLTIRDSDNYQASPDPECLAEQKARDEYNANCLSTGGQLAYGPLMHCGYVASPCEYHYKDAGKACHSSSECEGACLGAKGSPSGICAAFYSDTHNCGLPDNTVDGLKYSGDCF
jgi:hypothetical protein